MSRKKQVYEKITALYCRISLDDGGDNESMSISNQKIMLRDFAEKHGMFQYEYYVDDGYTGRNFNRPAFQLHDIVKELEKPARDPRDEMPKPILRTDVLEMKDLKEGMILKGTVRNVIDFGVFVDIGVHQDGLVHISQITDRYIKHPLEAVSVGDVVDVKVMSVDMKKKRIQLTMRGIS